MCSWDCIYKTTIENVKDEQNMGIHSATVGSKCFLSAVLTSYSQNDGLNLKPQVFPCRYSRPCLGI